MSIKAFLHRQAARAAYLVERALNTAECAANEVGVLPKVPPKKK